MKSVIQWNNRAQVIKGGGVDGIRSDEERRQYGGQEYQEGNQAQTESAPEAVPGVQGESGQFFPLQRLNQAIKRRNQ